jgi:NAD-dependent dihydropyrimidine dehydrogenase PreA subunit
MALIITDECINCDVCEPGCPQWLESEAQLREKYERLMGNPPPFPS